MESSLEGPAHSSVVLERAGNLGARRDQKFLWPPPLDIEIIV